MEEILLASAALNLIDKLIPQIRDQINSGELSPLQEEQARDIYSKMRAAGHDLYSGPEYELSGR